MPSPPWLVVIGGPNGAGKTTFARSAAARLSLRYLGADQMAERDGLGDSGPAAFRAGRLFTRALDAAVSRQESLLVEATLAGTGLSRLMRRARDSGYSVSIKFVFVDSVETCIARIRGRVQTGGHFVPDDDVRRRFRRSLFNFWERYRHEADDWHLTYNGSSGAVEVAFGDGSGAVVVDRGRFEHFVGLMEA